MQTKQELKTSLEIFKANVIGLRDKSLEFQTMFMSVMLVQWSNLRRMPDSQEELKEIEQLMDEVSCQFKVSLGDHL
jgi:hypothetical protein